MEVDIKNHKSFNSDFTDQLSVTDEPLDAVTRSIAQQQARSAPWPPLANLHREASFGCKVLSELLSSSCSCHCCRFTAIFPSCSPGIRRLDTFCTSSRTPDTSFPSGHCTPETARSTSSFLLACLRHQMLLICWHVLLVLDLDFVL